MHNSAREMVRCKEVWPRMHSLGLLLDLIGGCNIIEVIALTVPKLCIVILLTSVMSVTHFVRLPKVSGFVMSYTMITPCRSKFGTQGRKRNWDSCFSNYCMK